MKRFLAAVLVLVCLCSQALAADITDLRGFDEEAGYQYLELGTYPYEADGTVAPVTWRILKVDGETAILITEYIIDVRQVVETPTFSDQQKRRYRRFTTFPESDLYAWMQGPMLDTIFAQQDFRDALVEHENGLLYVMTNLEFMNEEYGFPHTKSGSTIENPGEKIVPEAVRRMAMGTPYAKQVRLYENWAGKNKTLYVDQNGCSPYWTSTMRSDNGKGFRLGIIGKNGHISWGTYGCVYIGVRPAAEIRLDALEVAGGSGTLEDPWKMEMKKDAE